MQLSAIAGALKAEVRGDADRTVARLVHPADAEGREDLAVALTDTAVATLPASRAGAVVVRSDVAVPPGMAAIIYSGHGRMALAVLTSLFAAKPSQAAGVDRSAAVAGDARIAADASIGPLVAVATQATVGAGTIILPGVTIGAGATIGADCVIHPGARIGDRVQLGDRVIVHPNAVIGADGYSFIPVRNPDGTRNPVDLPARIHSLGTVVVGDDVEIGAGTTIDRGTLRDTRIGRGTKIDNQVQIAHNAVIGECCIICGMVGIAGSAMIGDRAILAAASGVGDHVTVGEDATLSALAGVAADVPAGAVYDGAPAMPRNQAVERFMNVGRLKTLYPKVDDLRKRVEALEKDRDGG